MSIKITIHELENLEHEWLSNSVKVEDVYVHDYHVDVFGSTCEFVKFARFSDGDVCVVVNYDLFEIALPLSSISSVEQKHRFELIEKMFLHLGYVHTLKTNEAVSIDGEPTQVRFEDKLSIISHEFSYGGTLGLYEAWEYKKENDPVGYLTTAQTLEIIAKTLV